MESKFHMGLKGLRMITNLHCNYKCQFCYQGDKSKKILDLSKLQDQLDPVPIKHFDYCTIMGGESTLLPNLRDYVELGSVFAKETRLTTNGGLLDVPLARHLANGGLDGINVSISTIDHYNRIHTPHIDVQRMIEKIGNISKHVPDLTLRINLPLIYENMSCGCRELIRMLDKFVVEMGLNVTLCEDILGTWTLFDNFDKISAEVLEVTDYGLIFLDYAGHKIGYYTHRNNHYNETDLVVTPLGTWRNWDGYCQAVGMDNIIKQHQ